MEKQTRKTLGNQSELLLLLGVLMSMFILCHWILVYSVPCFPWQNMNTKKQPNFLHQSIWKDLNSYSDKSQISEEENLVSLIHL